MKNTQQQINSDSPTNQTYRELENAYHYFNNELFDGKLPNCLIVLQRKVKTMGYVSIDRWINREGKKVHELAINPEYFLGSSIEEVFQTMVHEQCHIWQHCFGKPGRRGYHNKEWSSKMVSIGLIPSNTGWPGGRQTGEEMDDYILDKGACHKAIQKLLSSGYWLTWVDRFTANTSIRPLKIFSSSEGNGSQTIKPTTPVAPLGNDYICQPRTEETLSPVTQNQYQDAEESSGIIAFQLAAKKPPTRIKYRCECQNQVWGKPNLRINCEDCEMPFINIE